MVADVSLRIEAQSPSEAYGRFHGLALDRDLPEEFWNVDSSYVIGTTGLGQRQFVYQATLASLSEGEHTISYGNSGYTWTAKIFINNQLVAEGPASRTSNLTATFTVGGVQPPAALDWKLLLIAAVGILGVGAVYFLTKKKG